MSNEKIDILKLKEEIDRLCENSCITIDNLLMQAELVFNKIMNNADSKCLDSDQGNDISEFENILRSAYDLTVKNRASYQYYGGNTLPQTYGAMVERKDGICVILNFIEDKYKLIRDIVTLSREKQVPYPAVLTYVTSSLSKYESFIMEELNRIKKFFVDITPTNKTPPGQSMFQPPQPIHPVYQPPLPTPPNNYGYQAIQPNPLDYAADNGSEHKRNNELLNRYKDGEREFTEEELGQVIAYSDNTPLCLARYILAMQKEASNKE